MKITFNPTRGLIIIPTRITGPKGDTIVRLALDTGATGSLLNWDIAMLIGYDPAAVKDRTKVTTGSGIEFSPRISINKIEIPGRSREHFPMLCHTLPPSASVEGVLGLDFFRGLRLIIDLKNGTVDFEE